MHDSLLKRDVYLVAPELFDNFFADAVGNSGAVIHVGGIAIKLKVQTVVSEIGKQQRRRRVFENLGIVVGYFQQQFFTRFKSLS